jgi:hypothetical protein
MYVNKKPNKAVQLVADAELIRFVNEQAKKKPDDSFLQVLNAALNMPRKKQDVIWWGALMAVWIGLPDKGSGLTKDGFINAVAKNHSKLTKGDSGRALRNTKLLISELVEACASHSKLTKADAG